MVRLAAFAVLALAVLNAQAQNPPPATLWYSAGHLALNVTAARTEFSASWQFDRADNGDVRIIKDEQHGTTKLSGTVMSVCDDFALLIKDIAPGRRHEMQEFDEPVLHLQLVLRLLARGLPQGPSAIGTATSIDFSDQKNPIRVRKGNAVRRDFDAPWQARGTVERDAQGGIKFDFAFSYTPVDGAGRRDEMKLTGVWQQKSPVSVFDNAFSIANWQVYRVDRVVNYAGGIAQIEPFLVSRPLRFKTLGELRTRIEHVWSENPKTRKQSECKL